MVDGRYATLHTYPSNWPRTSRKKVTRANLSFSIRFRLHHGSWGAKRIPFSLSSIHHSMPKDALRDGKGGWGRSTKWVMTGSALESFYHVFYLTSSAEKEIICKNRFSFASSTLNLFLSPLRLTHHHFAMCIILILILSCKNTSDDADVLLFSTFTFHSNVASF